MIKRIMGSLLAASLLFAATSALAQEERSYTEGPVTQVSSIKILPGMFDSYMKYLATTYKGLMEEYKKAGLIVDYAVYATNARKPSEPDLYLTITYKNWAAQDGLQDRLEPVSNKVWGSRSGADKASVDRGKMRESLGVEYIQELKLK
jgi:hypothetical protein